MCLRRWPPTSTLQSVVLLVLAACQESTAPARDVASLLLAPDRATLLVGDTLRLHATALGASGEPLPPLPVSFHSSNRAIATVDDAGLVTTLGSGTVEISASGGGRVARTSLLVQWGKVLGPAGGTLRALNGMVTLTLLAGAISAETRFVVDTARSPPVDAYALGGPAIALSPAGLVLHSPAQLSLGYRPEAVAGLAEVSVAMYADVAGGWLAQQGSVLDQARRVVTAPIDTMVVYRLLAPGPVATIRLQPDTVILVLPAPGAFTAELRDAKGAGLRNRSIAWSSSDTTVLRVSQLGVATPRSIGVVDLFARSGGATGRARVYVGFICPCGPEAVRRRPGHDHLRTTVGRPTESSEACRRC